MTAVAPFFQQSLRQLHRDASLRSPASSFLYLRACIAQLPHHVSPRSSSLLRACSAEYMDVPDYVLDCYPPLVGSVLRCQYLLQQRHSSLATAGCCPATGRGWRSCSCSLCTRETAGVCTREGPSCFGWSRVKQPWRVQNTSTLTHWCGQHRSNYRKADEIAGHTCSRHSQFLTAKCASATPRKLNTRALCSRFHVILRPRMSCSSSIARRMFLSTPSQLQTHTRDKRFKTELYSDVCLSVNFSEHAVAHGHRPSSSM